MADISIIIPCYNVEDEIDRCLTSIIGQSIGTDAFEIICVDDCSTDHTWDKLLAWDNQYPSTFIMVKSDENGRQGKARNLGLQYATGSWICYIDADDWVEPDYLEILYSHAQTQKYELVCCGNKRDFSQQLTFFSPSDREERSSDREIIIDTEEERKNAILYPPFGYSACGKMISKAFLLDHNLFFPEYITYEDIVWGALLNFYVAHGYLINKKLYHYYVNSSSTVLATNSNHHLDCILSQDLLWDEFIARGIMSTYHDELVIEHIYSGYLAGLKVCIFRYDTPDYNYYLLLRNLSIKKIPDFETNPYYLNSSFPELYKLALTSLKTPLSKPQFLEFAKYIRKIGI